MQDQTTEASRVPEPETPPDATLRDWLSSIGRKGGASKSARKLGAIAANLAKAQANRWKGKGTEG